VARIVGETFTWFTTANSPLLSDGIICLEYDSRADRLYIGTSRGMASYDCSQDRFIEDNGADSLRNVYVNALLADSKGRLWIGSRSGLWMRPALPNGWPEKGQPLTHLTTEQGMTNNVVRALAAGAGIIWASTDNGLTAVTMTDDGAAPVCRPFFDSDGLHGIVFSNNAALTTREGEVLLGCLTGCVCIPPENKYAAQPPMLCPPPRVRFTEFRINGQTVVKSPEGFDIEYGERLGVAISVMVPSLSGKARYLYRFKGEEEWMRAPNNILYFASLIPGTHVLQVKAELPGMMTTEVSELTFGVLPPPWLSKWAMGCYLLLLAAAVGLVWRAVRRRQKRELAMKQMELNLKKYEMEEQKISFFTNISHDIKTPLTMVMAPLEKIRDASLPAAVRTEIDVAWQNARQLYDLVLELLDFRRLDEGKEKLTLSHGELVSFVRRTAQGFNYIASRRNITMELRLPATPVEMLFDENKMRRIIINLLSNACKYNVEGGSVVVTLTTSAVGATISVADTGIGVKDKRRIFDRFAQETHGQEQEGSGLGLHIVRQYVDMMGGSITADDNEPRGTVFTVTLPIMVPNTDDEAEAATAPAATDATPTILVVEDNTDARLFLQRSLEDEYHVLTAANGREALGQLAKAGGSVNIIISDVMMPVMDGMELVRQIRKDIHFSHIPVILLTAKSSEENIIAGLREGAEEYLTKPFSLTVLRLRIRRILERTRLTHEQVATGIEIKASDITVSSLDEEFIGHVIAEVEANISDQNYSVVQLSTAVGMTRGTLYKKLMAIVGKSPVEFIRIVRLKRGKSLLDQGRTNVSEVADRVGISPKMFAQYFREMYGCTPSDYLRQRKSL
jgi:signal transduction histidine kinase/DNA-binding response OmpR family regulator